MPERYRITVVRPDAETEQTWTLLPDRDSAETQAEELARREKSWRVRLYREATFFTPMGEGELISDSA